MRLANGLTLLHYTYGIHSSKLRSFAWFPFSFLINRNRTQIAGYRMCPSINPAVIFYHPSYSIQSGTTFEKFYNAISWAMKQKLWLLYFYYIKSTELSSKRFVWTCRNLKGSIKIPRWKNYSSFHKYIKFMAEPSIVLSKFWTLTSCQAALN